MRNIPKDRPFCLLIRGVLACTYLFGDRDNLTSVLVTESGQPQWTWNTSLQQFNVFHQISEWSLNYPMRNYRSIVDLTQNSAALASIASFERNSKTRRQGIAFFGVTSKLYGPRQFSETWIYSPEINAWGRTTTHPSPKWNPTHAMVTLCSSYIVLIETHRMPYDQPLQDIWILNVQQNKWQKIKLQSDEHSPYHAGELIFYDRVATIADRRTRCRCKEAILLIGSDEESYFNIGRVTGWDSVSQLVCVNDTQVYKWRSVDLGRKGHVFPTTIRYNSVVTSSPPTTLYIMDEVSLWQYTTDDNTWETVHNLTNPKYIDWDCIKWTLLIDREGERRYMLFHRTLEYAYEFSFLLKQWMKKYIVGSGKLDNGSWQPVVCNNEILFNSFSIGDFLVPPKWLKLDIGPQLHEDLWTWRTIPVPAMFPVPCRNPVTDVPNDNMYVLCGLDADDNYAAAMWKLSLNDMTWEKLPPYPRTMSANFDSRLEAGTLLGDDIFLLCGISTWPSLANKDFKTITTTVRGYSIGARIWLEYGSSHTPDEQPMGRFESAIVGFNKSSLLMFGGTLDASTVYQPDLPVKVFEFAEVVLNDTWILSISDSHGSTHYAHWSLVNSSAVIPLARHMAAMKEIVTLFGGADGRGQCIDDMWNFNVIPVVSLLWSQVQQVCSNAVSARRDIVSMDYVW